MRIVIINSSDTFEYRIGMIYEYLKRNGNDVTVITSDFMHIEKKRRKRGNRDYILVHVIPYFKNISLRRLYSHFDFSRHCCKMLKKMEVDLLYIVVPPNSQAAIAKYCQRKGTKIVMDIIDLWPESLPLMYTDYFPFSLWAWIRNRNLKYADVVITECRLYQQKLKNFLQKKEVKTVYWAHKNRKEAVISRPDPSNKKWNLCYLGSINNIIDITEIGNIIKHFGETKPVVLRIIGDGEQRQQLIDTAVWSGAEIVYYGKIYDAQKKQDIFDLCHFGLNIMKDTVCVGLSMKSIDYLEGGLPLISNLQGDTEQLIRRYQCGINENDADWINDAVGFYDTDTKRSNARICYMKHFTYDRFEKNIGSIFAGLFPQEDVSI